MNFLRKRENWWAAILGGIVSVAVAEIWAALRGASITTEWKEIFAAIAVDPPIVSNFVALLCCIGALTIFVRKHGMRVDVRYLVGVLQNGLIFGYALYYFTVNMTMTDVKFWHALTTTRFTLGLCFAILMLNLAFEFMKILEGKILEGVPPNQIPK